MSKRKLLAAASFRVLNKIHSDFMREVHSKPYLPNCGSRVVKPVTCHARGPLPRALVEPTMYINFSDNSRATSAQPRRARNSLKSSIRERRETPTVSHRPARATLALLTLSARAAPIRPPRRRTGSPSRHAPTPLGEEDDALVLAALPHFVARNATRPSSLNVVDVVTRNRKT